MGCLACEAACKQEHNLPVGPRWIRVFPDVRETGGRWRFNYHVTECVHAAPGPCQVACPAEMNAWKYVNLALLGKFKEGLEVIRETTPFAGVLGSVCTRPCESNCERGKVDAPVGIRSLKYFLAEHEMQAGRKKATLVKQTKDSQVAIIGSGPAGLSCARDLVGQGYPVTVFETRSQPGGLLRSGIPEFRLSRDIVDNEIGYIQELGVDIRTNTPVENLKDVFNQGYKAIFLGTGCPTSLKLDIPNEDAKGVVYALDFLNRVNSGGSVTLGERVAVIGGGAAAIDTARVCLRGGAREVHLVCLESRDLTCKDRMLAQACEIEEAEEEGLIVHPSLGPKSILTKNGKVAGLDTIVCTSVREADGTFAPDYAEGPAPTIEADTIVVAIGQKPEAAAFKELDKDPAETIRVDGFTLKTNIDGVFAGGDVVSGPSDVIGAIAAGKEAAVSIERYLSGMDLKEGRSIKFRLLNGAPLEAALVNRVMDIPGEEVAIAEAMRCFNCGTCGEALQKGFQSACASACPAHCIYFRDVWEITPKTGTYTLA
ncbi:MAG TPA: FAD-dependent oxidoreductase [Anaerolineae bacterium]|nr:FAD-dependent oxidoreductase [Anaerolineae bacterium]